MQLGRTLEQQIAVFGGRGSGKTVLLSSFYGATQEPQFGKKNPFYVMADDFGQGNRLHRNYLGMKDSTPRLPRATNFTATSYSFSIKLKDASGPRAKKARPFDALRLVWHDYPGEWFEQDVSGPEEAQRRVDTFRSLLGSHVALLLVDAQRLLDNEGEEERYLKSLLANFRNGLLSLKDDILTDGKPLVEVPRIWIFALSKSDLLPQMNVFNFRDLLISKAGEEITELREVIAGFVEASDALSVGEDFLLLSSAKFSPGRIEVSERVGLELILPLAAMLPFERHVRWAEALQKGSKVAENLVGGAKVLSYVLTGVVAKSKLPAPVGKVLTFVMPWLSDAAVMAGSKLAEARAEALVQQDHLRAALTGFRIDLESAEEKHIFIRSRR
ncbi:hypothetical protein ACK8GG_17150 [Micromonosporaceae bacterium DT55]|uniref:hypothetical protein n=1 Tax=Melissospora conviva TaxID=3388432 RepID=UPI003C1638E1